MAGNKYSINYSGTVTINHIRKSNKSPRFIKIMTENSKRSIQLKTIQDDWSSCQKCPELVEERTNIVFGVGQPDSAKIVIIGEAPGKNEDLKCEPFVGRSGQILNELLSSINLTRADVYITNTILCRPPKNRNPKSDELSNCRPRLDAQIKALNPKVVITLGNFATRYMLNTKEGITDLHGKLHTINNINIVPMFHPAALLYAGQSPEKRKEMEDDFKVVQSLLG